MSQRYFGYFTDFAQILGSWGTIHKDAIVPESDSDVLFANYGSEHYEGSADVVFRRDGNLYHVSGAHCSCYGLEECGWHAEEVPVGMLVKYSPDLADRAASLCWSQMIQELSA